MLYIGADHHYFPFSFNDLAFFANGFYRWSYFHLKSLLLFVRIYRRTSRFAAPRDPASGEVVG